MKILGLGIKNYRQFRSFYLDCTNPDTHAPLDKVCLIGANGTGKSTVLSILSEFLRTGNLAFPDSVRKNSTMGLALQINKQKIWVTYSPAYTQSFFKYDVVKAATWQDFWLDKSSEENEILRVHSSDLKSYSLDPKNEIFSTIKLKKNDKDVAIYSPADASSLLKRELPDTNLSIALKLFKEFPHFHLCSYENINDFWNLLIYQIKNRESQWQAFLEDSENQSLSVADARTEFDERFPSILPGLAKQWNLILERAGLELDVNGAKAPIQLNENLRAYIRLKDSCINVDYDLLSNGIRNFIFRLGHIYSLYFNRKIERGFLLIDEPEASLFPDLLYDIVERYMSIIENTQFFVATQSPIIAAQFKPEERIILEFDDEHYVTCRRGISPEGDDPNDLLLNDFLVRSLYGKKGIEQWNRYLELRRIIPDIEDAHEKRQLMTEYARIGNTYNFIENEIPG